jgi:hypothetical protein
MLFKLDIKKGDISKVERVRLRDIDWKEIDLQRLLFKHLTSVIQEEELLVISQSRSWQEEPDLMAIDIKGDLWIFELKAWESDSDNLLQVLRYGQIFGQYDYDDLNSLFSVFKGKILLDAHKKIFPTMNIKEEDFNKNQHFIVMTNGLDIKTREAIIYWKEKNLDVRPWIYRLFRPENKVNSEIYIEFDTFRKEDDPFEDIDEGYFIINTNISHSEDDDKDMMDNKKAAAYFSPWKDSMTRIQKGDRVFLYRSGDGIVATGKAKGKYKKKDYHNDQKFKNEEYYVELEGFYQLKKPLTATNIIKLTGVNYRFMRTCFSIDKESGELILKESSQRAKNTN